MNECKTCRHWITKRMRTYLAIVSAAAAANVIGNLILIPRFGFIAAAATTCAAYGVQLAAALVIGRRLVPWPLPSRHAQSAAVGETRPRSRSSR